MEDKFIETEMELSLEQQIAILRLLGEVKNGIIESKDKQIAVLEKEIKILKGEN